MFSSHLTAWYPAPDSFQLRLQPPDVWLVPITPAKAACSGVINHEATSAILSYTSYLHLYSGSTTGAIATNGTWHR